MEQLLLKLARQLDAMDEASLMVLWDTYAEKVHRFEPTRRWEEAALVFSLIQAKRWKNQLFNQQWAKQTRPNETNVLPQTAFSLEKPRAQNGVQGNTAKKAKVLQFQSPKQDKEC